MGRALELTGQRFGKLVALHKTDKRQGSHVLWLCMCDCGNTTEVQARHLKNGHTRSCCGAKPLEPGLAAARHIIRQYKRNASDRGLEYALTEEQALDLHGSPCHYCGVEPSTVFGADGFNGDFVYNGIDRVDNDKGYTKQNSVPCCSICNYAKKSQEYGEFVVWLDRVARFRHA